MNSTKVVPLIILCSSLVGCTAARTDYARADQSRYPGQILSKEEVADNYCHTKFRAPESADPANSNAPGDIVDYYGACDEMPGSGDLAWEQHLFRQHQLESDYSG